jgi:hypothetical protein
MKPILQSWRVRFAFERKGEPKVTIVVTVQASSHWWARERAIAIVTDRLWPLNLQLPAAKISVRGASRHF